MHALQNFLNGCVKWSIKRNYRVFEHVRLKRVQRKLPGEIVMVPK